MKTLGFGAKSQVDHAAKMGGSTQNGIVAQLGRSRCSKGPGIFTDQTEMDVPLIPELANWSSVICTEEYLRRKAYILRLFGMRQETVFTCHQSGRI